MAANMARIEASGNHDFSLGMTPITLKWNFSSDFSALIDVPLARVIKSPKEKIQLLRWAFHENSADMSVFKNYVFVHSHTRRQGAGCSYFKLEYPVRKSKSEYVIL